MPTIERFALLYALTICGNPASAQDFSAVASGYSLQASNTLSMIVAGTGSRAVRQRAEEESGAAGRVAQNSNSRFATRSQATVETRYQPTPELARATVEGYVDRLKPVNPEASQAVAQQFRANDYDKIYRNIVAPFNLRDNDVRDAVTAYTVLGWMIATGATDPTSKAVSAARDQLGQRLVANPRFAPPGTRAQLGEEFKLLFVTLHAGWQSARREGNVQRYSDGVSAMFAKQGTDLRALRLTEQGFVTR